MSLTPLCISYIYIGNME